MLNPQRPSHVVLQAGKAETERYKYYKHTDGVKKDNSNDAP